MTGPEPDLWLWEQMRKLKALPCWGEQNGLLSVSEMVLLSELAADDNEPVLEVGHYCGLSTVALMHESFRTVVTVDNHAGDQWVPKPAGVDAFLENVDRYGPNKHQVQRPHVAPLFIPSQVLHAPLHYSMIFYDGDHGAEQMRFTEEVHKSPKCTLYVFDDRDFPVPAQCCEWLRSMGWKDESPPVVRGGNDKASEETMSLGVFRR